MQNYKKLGIEYFYKGNFSLAKMYFSLAYERRKNKRLLHFISLCDLAQKNPKEAFLLFEFYLAHYSTRDIDKDFEQILHSIELKEGAKQQSEFEDGYALNYKDFLKSEELIGFEKSFENVIFGGKLVIDKREDCLEFLEKLFENGYEEMALSYMESVAVHFWANERFIRLQERLMGHKNESKS
ncbi:histidine kinase [Campylobacter sp. MIT 21-1685]|uniref:histidine kinase n=1 Tax=unclassified Campylobacter TaxID=2593542 RepID=UPI00224A9952|nr:MULTISPECIES: histidine kinase [unclassified Campylobacter]MCX2683363.1 histidine kinase [Campylobacter sp. MIT 21-1684]MCX2751582.1 histidine kinase [Campylobacter sp. MIT 21-1682]MCX2807781.1 histidine kinase [Campylobacter sp. MIT 21-1685]